MDSSGAVKTSDRILMRKDEKEAYDILEKRTGIMKLVCHGMIPIYI